MGAASRPCSTTTSTRRTRSRSSTSGADHELLRRGARRLRARLARGAGRGAGGGRRRSRSGAQDGAGRARTSPRRTGCAARSRRPAGTCATTRPAASSSSAGVTREPSTGAAPVREALRGPREVLELWATERAPRRRTGSPRRAPACRSSPSASSPRRRTRDHQGVVAWCEPYRYADAWELAARRGAAARVPRPGHRPAQSRRRLPERRGRGATGVVVPPTARRGVTAAVAERRPARSSTCRSRSSRTWRATRRRSSAPTSGSTPPRGDAETPMWDADFPGGVALVLGAEGKGCGRSCAGVRRGGVDPARRRRRVAQRQRRRGGAALRGAAGSASVADPTLYLFDGYNMLHAGGFADARELRDALASFVALRGARGVARLRRRGEDETSARSRCATPRTRTRCSSGSPAENRATRAGVPRLVGRHGPRRRPGRQVRSSSSQTFLGELGAVVHDEAQALQLARPGRPRDARRARAPAPRARLSGPNVRSYHKGSTASRL